MLNQHVGAPLICYQNFICRKTHLKYCEMASLVNSSTSAYYISRNRYTTLHKHTYIAFRFVTSTPQPNATIELNLMRMEKSTARSYKY
jgi:hypothetical protein